MKKIKISEKNYYCKDEKYCGWYKCPNCEDTNITYYDNYCSNCGSKLEWEDKSK